MEDVVAAVDGKEDKGRRKTIEGGRKSEERKNSWAKNMREEGK